MKYFNFKLFGSKTTELAICGLLSMFGMAGPASADCETGDNDLSHYTLLIDASSSCSNLSEGMFGCEVDGTGCRIEHDNGRTIDVAIYNSSVGGIDPINWLITSSSHGDLVDLGILVGANKGGSCGIVYTPGSASGEGLIFRKANGDGQKVSKLFFCSDFIQPAPAEPLLVVTKTVVLTPEDENVDADCTSSSVETLDIAVGDEVTYCYKVKNVGAGDAQDVTLVDDKGTPGDSHDVDLMDSFFGDPISPPGQLLSGATAYGTLDVTITSAGTLVNTATAKLAGTFEASDTATVNAVLVAQACPLNFQKAVNQLAVDTGLDYAFLLDPNQGGKFSVCAPNGDDEDINTGFENRAIRVQCVDQCVTKPECQDPSSTLCTGPSVCEPSGSWTTKRTGTEPSTFACTDLAVPTPVTDPLPYCWEIQQDLDGICSTTNKWEPQEETVLNIKKGHVNPYVWQSCYSSGGRYVCETFCYAFSAADALACPPGSTVF